MHNSRLFSVCWLGFVLCPAMIFAQAQPSAPSAVATVPNPKTPAEFFTRARQLSDLEAAGIPFHLKATYVASGNAEFTGNGTYEEWWKSKDDWRIEATLGSFKHVALPNRSFSNSEYVPVRLRQAMADVLVHIPEDQAANQWKMNHEKLSGVDLTVFTQKKNCETDQGQAKCVAQFYFTSEGLLRIQREGATGTLYNNFQRFQNLLIPRRIDLSTGTVLNLAISIDSLDVLPSDLKIQSDIASLPGDMKPPTPYVVFASGLAATKLIYHVQPVYPIAARQQRIQGTVMMKATIDKNGNLREPQVISSPSPVLDSSALQAVRQWRYQPVVLAGTPVMVDTTISVIFRLR